MAVESPPFALQAGSYGAEQTRRAIASHLARGASIGSISGGIVAVGDCLLTPPGSGMTVNVAPGEVWVPGTTSSTQSGYYCRVSSATNLAIAAADPSNPRVDRVVALITDAAYSGGTNTFAVSVVTGTPTAGATLANLNGAAAAPASSLTLGYVLVPNGSTNVTGGNISNVVPQQLLGLGGFGSRGTSNIATTQSTSSASFTTLATPDQVTNIVMPTNGLILVGFQGTWQESVSAAASACIALNGTPAKIATAGNANVPSVGIGGASTGRDVPLSTSPAGLVSVAASAGSTGDVTTGQIVGVSGSGGGVTYLFAAAGTYTVSIMFAASSGTVTVKNRKLWVLTQPFS
jgi:hypothetical protein